MPSPVGHSLIGFAIAAAAMLRPAGWRNLAAEAWRKRWLLLGAIALANAPDVDYLPGIFKGNLNHYHHLYTHTLGWVLLVTCAAWLGVRSFRPASGWKLFGLMLALTASHLAADYLTDDGRPPYGIMLTWPISDEFTIAQTTVFMRLHKRAWSEVVQWHNVQAVAWEFIVCLPLVILGVAVACASGRRAHRPTAGRE
jgi:inner membrane protein